MTHREESIELFFKEGSADKVYNAQLVACADGWRVTFQYGRRGKPLKAGEKTKEAISYERAKDVYEKLVKSKTSKGYTPEEGGTPFAGVETAGEATGLRPQLLAPIGEGDLDRLSWPSWIWQEKMDGERRLVRRRGDEVVGVNRRGLSVPIDQRIVDNVRALPGGDLTLDGEDMGDGRYAVFDLLESWGEDARDKPFETRLRALGEILGDSPSPDLFLVAGVSGGGAAVQLFEELRARDAEGIVGKQATAPYEAGRFPTQVKFKFVETATAIVAPGRDGKRSIGLEMLNEAGEPVAVGNVSVPAGRDLPAVGDLVEVRYLYAYPGGALYQPVYLGPRPDMTREETRISSLKLSRSSAAA